MRNLMFFIMVIAGSLFILQSCQKSELEEPIQNEDSKIHKRIALSHISTNDVYCTVTRDCKTPDPFGACLLRFPPKSSTPIFPESVAKGLVFADEANNLTLYMITNQTLPEDAQNSEQSFLINDMIIPSEITDKLFSESSPGQITLENGDYTAIVHDNHLTLTIPSDFQLVSIVIWYNQGENSSDLSGYMHNKWISELHNENWQNYASLSTNDDINEVIIQDCEEMSTIYGYDMIDLENPIVNGLSPQEMILDIADLSTFEKEFLVNFSNEIEEIDPFSVQGISNALALINTYESSVNNNAEIENKEAVLTILAVCKHSTMYWHIESPTFDEPTPQARRKRFWRTVLYDAIGAGLGFLFGGPVGSVITGVAYSVVINLLYKHFFPN